MQVSPVPVQVDGTVDDISHMLNRHLCTMTICSLQEVMRTWTKFSSRNIHGGSEQERCALKKHISEEGIYLINYYYPKLSHHGSSTLIFILDREDNGESHNCHAIRFQWRGNSFCVNGPLPFDRLAQTVDSKDVAYAVQVQYHPGEPAFALPSFRLFSFDIPKKQLSPPHASHFVDKYKEAVEALKVTCLPSEEFIDEVFAKCVALLDSKKDVPIRPFDTECDWQSWNIEVNVPMDNLYGNHRGNFIEIAQRHLYSGLETRFKPYGYRVRIDAAACVFPYTSWLAKISIHMLIQYQNQIVHAK
jgi:hypothetical protein